MDGGSLTTTDGVETAAEDEEGGGDDERGVCDAHGRLSWGVDVPGKRERGGGTKVGKSVGKAAVGASGKGGHVDGRAVALGRTMERRVYEYVLAEKAAAHKAGDSGL